MLTSCLQVINSVVNNYVDNIYKNFFQNIWFVLVSCRIFALAAKEKTQCENRKEKFFEKNSPKIWRVLEKGIIFAPLSPLKRRESKKEIIGTIKRETISTERVYWSQDRYIKRT